MSYSAAISRDNPGCMIFLIDQSSSMSRPFGLQPTLRKSDSVADAVNKLLHTLCIRCSKADGVRDYFQIGVIGYGNGVKPVLHGSSQDSGLVSIKTISEQPLRVENRTVEVPDGAGGLVTQTKRFPVWFDPVAAGKTPMREAFALARQWLTGYLRDYPDCYPPLIINLTDGVPDEGQDPSTEVAALQQLGSSDGKTLVFNIHISSLSETPIVFANDEGKLPDERARSLFRMSSVLPDSFMDIAAADGFPVTSASRGFAFNADLVAVIKLIDIGTRSQQKRLA